MITPQFITAIFSALLWKFVLLILVAVFAIFLLMVIFRLYIWLGLEIKNLRFIIGDKS